MHGPRVKHEEMFETTIECAGLESLYLCLIIAVLDFLVLLAR